VGLVEVPLVTLFLVLLQVRPDGSATGAALLVAVLLLATVGLVTVSTLFSVVAAGSRLGTSMLPLLVLPVVLPLVVAAVEASRRGLGGDLVEGGQQVGWLGLLCAFDLLVLVAGVATFPYLVEE
jgi:heme exporter protein B